jgi:hypothetical protein
MVDAVEVGTGGWCPWQPVVDSEVCGSLVPPPPHRSQGADGFLGAVGVLSSLAAALSIGGHVRADLVELLSEVVTRGEQHHWQSSQWWAGAMVHDDGNNSSTSVSATTAVSMASSTWDATCAAGRC